MPDRVELALAPDLALVNDTSFGEASSSIPSSGMDTSTGEPSDGSKDSVKATMQTSCDRDNISRKTGKSGQAVQAAGNVERGSLDWNETESSLQRSTIRS